MRYDPADSVPVWDARRRRRLSLAGQALGILVLVALICAAVAVPWMLV